MEEKATQSIFKFLRYIVNDSVIRLKDNNISNNFRMNLNLDAETDGTNPISKLRITIDLSDTNEAISAHVSITGFFESTNCDKTQRDLFICHNAPAILFPYIRAYVSCVTSQSGIAPVIIPTVNLQKQSQNLFNQISQPTENPQ